MCLRLQLNTFEYYKHAMHIDKDYGQKMSQDARANSSAKGSLHEQMHSMMTEGKDADAPWRERCEI